MNVLDIDLVGHQL